MKKLFSYSFLIAVSLAFLSTCKKDPVLPPNPYDDVNYNHDTTAVTPPDPNSFTGIYQNILNVKCKNPGCHDGTFEPDYRSVQSAWRTLVYAPVIKNTVANSYFYRVVPYDISKSILYYRVSQGDDQLQQMPATGQYLTTGELANVETWINAGAPDMFGNLPQFPNLEPVYQGFVAIDSVFHRLDTSRVGGIYYNPFYVNHNSTVQIAFLIHDDSTAVPNMQYNKLKFSFDKDDYSAATTYNAAYVNLAGTSLWVATVNTGAFPADTTVYFRYYFNDGDHAQNTEFPRTDMSDPYKTYSAMRIRP